MMLSNEVKHVLQLCTDACFNGNTETRTSVCWHNARRPLATRMAHLAFRSTTCRIQACLHAATSSTSFDSIIHPMDQGKSTFNYMSIGWLFRKIFRKNRGQWRVGHLEYTCT